MKRYFLAILLFVATCTASLAQVAIGFGPNPRSLDNLSVWNYAVGPARNRWNALYRAGVDRIVINPTFLMRHQLQLPRTGTPAVWIPRPEGTYLTWPGFMQMKDMVHIGGFEFAYSAGIGLSGDRCAAIASNPTTGGEIAATIEYNNVLIPMLNAGVPLHEIEVDGAFLRLIAGSEKQYSCAAQGAGFTVGNTVKAVDAYLKKLTSLISLHSTQTGIDLDVVLTVNLPNWKVEEKPRNSNATATDVGLLGVLDTFVQHRALNGYKPQILRMNVDYPYCYIQGKAPCAKGGTTVQNEVFVHKMVKLWDHSRHVNGTGFDVEKPNLSVIINTHKEKAVCVTTGALYPYVLMYRAYKPQPPAGSITPPSRWKWVEPSSKCQKTQRKIDAEFMAVSVSYANRLKATGDLGRAMSRNGNVVISKVIFQAWGHVPLSNAWYIEKVRYYAN